MRRALVICLNLALLPAAILALAASPRAGEPVVVITNPLEKAAAAEVIARAGGSILAAGRSAHVAVAAPGDRTLLTRLREAGALLLLDGSAAVICGTPIQQRV